MPTPSLLVMNPNAAAIDVGSEELHVSIAGGRPKVFGTMTGDLHKLRDWFKAEGVQSVAMEATGVYWLCPYEVLENAGLEVVVVNGKYVPANMNDMCIETISIIKLMSVDNRTDITFRHCSPPARG